ncbi:hypothetical protein OHS58_17050 [Amycolatopsis sp. NBC_00348]|uniref:hypothetical protein n=1 Tax=Amycolatopsis sp. NBC_00348 TaxID=2975956 RepID=UPI002E25CBD4
MTTAIAAAPVARAGDTDNRATYLSFGLAYVFGHGAAAVSGGDDPLVRLPGWLPMTLLGLGLAAGTVFATLAAARASAAAPTSSVAGSSACPGSAASRRSSSPSPA